ncbi:hypothetical protein BCR33DRAFT_774025 [Rhizoclosmatium globosum]|uniref:MYND-type domain-containing protein n=1 Tax=Rhizoclosmatium globosum TaxID=329046 RepID=A0A1Y2AUX2_9FUNG|nr:hypothetical protein BCR33DRAFT_774025 [Rhizoclosmatium globosum]|eukprot:ORY26007.1 hypothetical protein BCR33DRAFT_774025 [Rhizoclosmatium globosum]
MSNKDVLFNFLAVLPTISASGLSTAKTNLIRVTLSVFLSLRNLEDLETWSFYLRPSTQEHPFYASIILYWIYRGCIGWTRDYAKRVALRSVLDEGQQRLSTISPSQLRQETCPMLKIKDFTDISRVVTIEVAVFKNTGLFNLLREAKAELEDLIQQSLDLEIAEKRLIDKKDWPRLISDCFERFLGYPNGCVQYERSRFCGIILMAPVETGFEWTDYVYRLESRINHDVLTSLLLFKFYSQLNLHDDLEIVLAKLKKLVRHFASIPSNECEKVQLDLFGVGDDVSSMSLKDVLFHNLPFGYMYDIQMLISALENRFYQPNLPQLEWNHDSLLRMEKRRIRALESLKFRNENRFKISSSFQGQLSIPIQEAMAKLLEYYEGLDNSRDATVTGFDASFASFIESNSNQVISAIGSILLFKIEIMRGNCLPMNLFTSIQALTSLNQDLWVSIACKELASLPVKDKSCRYCHKKFPDVSLITCRMCQQILYCSRVCSMADWTVGHAIKCRLPGKFETGDNVVVHGFMSDSFRNRNGIKYVVTGYDKVRKMWSVRSVKSGTRYLWVDSENMNICYD